MLRSIRLCNWRSHRDTTLHFARGTNLLIGRMGGGKTSIVDAICYALFGTCPPIASHTIKIRDIIRARPNGEDAAYVELTFSKGNKEYRVCRSIKRSGATEAELWCDGVRIQGPRPRDVDRYVTELLELDADLFMRAVYSQQNQIDYLLTLPPSERKDKIDELLGLTKFEVVRDNAMSAVRRLGNIRKDIEIVIQRENVEQLLREVSELNAVMESVSEMKKRKKAELSAAEQNLSKAERKFAHLNATRAHFIALTQREVGLVHSIEAMKRDIEKVDVGKKEDLEKLIRQTKNKKADIQAKICQLEKEIETQMSVQTRIQAALLEAEKNLKKRKAAEKELTKLLNGQSIEHIEAKYAALKNEISALTIDEASALANFKTLSAAIDELKKEITRCPICDTPLDVKQKQKLLNEKSAALSNARKECENIEKKLEKCTLEFEDCERKISCARELNAIIKEFQNVEEEMNKFSSEVSTLSAQVRNLRKRKEALQLEYEKVQLGLNELEKEYSKICDAIEKRKAIDDMAEELQRIRLELSKLSFDEKEWESAQSEYNEMKVKIATLSGELNKIQSEVHYVREKIKDREQRIAEINKKIEIIQKCDVLIDKLQRFANILADIQVELRTTSLEEINSALKEIWPIIYPYSDYTSLKIIPVENDYLLQFEIGNGNFVQVDGIGSGGERALACLALRIALALVLTPQLSWIILDEPTHNLDDEAVRALATTLRDHVPKILEQAIVITHDEGLKDAASEKVFRFDRDKETPEITIVEEIC